MQVDGCTGLTSVLHAHLLGATEGLTELSMRQCPDLLALQGAQSLGQLTQLVKVDMSGCSSLSDTFLARLVAERPRASLTWLDVSDGGHLTDAGLDLLGEAYPSLRYLAVQRNPCITDAGVEAVVRRCEVLDTLLLSGLSLLTDRCVTVMTVLHKGLRTLGLSGCPRLTDEALHCLGDCTRLISLDVSGCVRVTDRGLARLSSKGLTSLHACRLPLLTDQGLQALATKLPGLQTLDLSACTQVAGCTHPPNLPALLPPRACLSVRCLVCMSSCVLGGAAQVTPSGVEVLLSSCTSLTSLNAHDCPSVDVAAWAAPEPHQLMLTSRFLGAVLEPGFSGFRLVDRWSRAREMERRRAEREQQAALRIQPWFRIIAARRAAEQARKLHKAERLVAVRMVQAAMRGFLIRKKMRIIRKLWKRFVPIFR